jgi:phage terminase large subunit
VTTLRIETAAVFEPLLAPARYKGAWGGRGGGKSHFVAGKLVEDALVEPGDNSGEGLRAVCIREVQKDLTQSSKALIESKLREFGLGEAQGFKAFRDCIKTPGDGIIIFKGMNDYTAESIKSLENFKRAWCEEAQTITPGSLMLLKPTIRANGAEMVFTWNPRKKSDAVDVLLRGNEQPTGAVVVQALWKDNPWFPKDLEQERLDCLRIEPEQYAHIWEGDYVSVASGAYFAKQLAQCLSDRRIGRITVDPLLPLRAYIDIGGTGAKADAFAMWIVQYVGKEIRVLDYYEAVGQPLAEHVNWLRERKYSPLIVLPHDGANHDKVFSVSYQSAFRQAGYETRVVPNLGQGAAATRIEAVRRIFPNIWFHEMATQAGREALGWYHEKRDPTRSVGLGPDHDWSSHAADAFGLMAIDYEQTANMITSRAPIQYRRLHH